MSLPLAEIIEMFQSVDVETRLDLLLDYAKKLPAIDERYAAERDAGMHRVPECMSPVFLWIEATSTPGQIRIILDVAEEAPTIKGLLSIVMEAFEICEPTEIESLPYDLVHQLGLSSVIRMNRAQGIEAIITRIRRGVQSAASNSTINTEQRKTTT